MLGTILQKIRTTFLAGLLVAVPLGVCAWVLVLLVTFLEKAIILVPKFLQPEVLLGFKIPGLGVLLAVTTLFLLGVGAQSYLGRQLVMLYEIVLLRVPILSSVYKGVKQLMENLFANDKGFEKVVLVEWPREGLWSVAFHTGEALVTQEGTRMINVFLPTTPNPTTGFFFMLPEDRVMATEMSVEEAFQLLMSAGIVKPVQAVQLAGELPEHIPPHLAIAGNQLASGVHRVPQSVIEKG